MTFLRRLIARFNGSGQPATRKGRQHFANTGGGQSRSDAMWDEALMAAMHCEAARKFLDHMGPRWK